VIKKNVKCLFIDFTRTVLCYLGSVVVVVVVVAVVTLIEARIL